MRGRRLGARREKWNFAGEMSYYSFDLCVGQSRLNCLGVLSLRLFLYLKIKGAVLYQTHFGKSEAEVPLEDEQSRWQEEGRGVQPKGAERRGFPFGAGKRSLGGSSARQSVTD